MVPGGKAGGGAGQGGAAVAGGEEGRCSAVESRYWRMSCEKWKGVTLP